jgi:hypothetical protein
MLKIFPPTEIEPLRGAVEVFAATVNVRVREPVPLAGVTEIHETLLLAVNAQEGPAVRFMLDDAPAAGAEKEVLANSNEQTLGWIPR